MRFTNANKFCFFKNIALSIINFGSKLFSSFLCMIIFHAKLWFWQAPNQWTKIEFWISFSEYIKLMITILALFSYSNANFAVIYLIWFTSVICFMLFFIFTLIRFSILAPVDTLNLAFGCSLSKPTLSAGWFVGRSVLICWFSVYGWSSSSPAAAVNLSIPYFLSSLIIMGSLSPPAQKIVAWRF